MNDSFFLVSWDSSDSLALPLRALLTRLNFGVEVVGECLFRL